MADNQQSTRAIYDGASSQWARNKKLLLSDFTARPYVLEMIQPLSGIHVLDLGCGEGFVARQVRAAGAASVIGIDLSEGMIQQARAEEKRLPQGIKYRQENVALVQDVQENGFDRVIAVFLFNYLTSEEMTKVMRRVRGWLKSGGRFVFTVPHPSLPFMRGEDPPFFFHRPKTGYFSAKDMTLEGKIWRRDGVAVPVRCVHKPLEVYFQALRDAGWKAMPDLMELRVQPEHIELDSEFFGPLLDVPLHILFSLESEK